MAPVRTVLIVVLWLGALLGYEAAAAQSSSACAPGDPVTVEAHTDYFLRAFAARDSSVREAQVAFELERVDSNSVAFVSDSAICVAAVAAVNAVAGTPGRERKVLVYRLGKAYAVEDPALTQPLHDYPFYLFDDKWRSRPVLMY